MTLLFGRVDAIACRSCGAKEAAGDTSAKYDLCEDCWRQFFKYCRYGKHEATENVANMWIAKQLFQNAKRLDKYGIAGRCEAITEGANDLMQSRPRWGYQCCCRAIALREGRKVCWHHSEAKSIKVRFVAGGGQLGIYDEFERIIIQLCKTDPGFLGATQNALSVLASPVTPAEKP